MALSRIICLLTAYVEFHTSHDTERINAAFKTASLFLSIYIYVLKKSVKTFINELGRRHFSVLPAKVRRCKSYFLLSLSVNVAIHNLLWTCLLDDQHNDDCPVLILINKHDAENDTKLCASLITYLH